MSKRTCEILLAVSFAVCSVGIGFGDSLWVVTAPPLLLAAAVLRIVTPYPKHLKQIGWSLLVVNILSGIVAVGIWNY